MRVVFDALLMVAAWDMGLVPLGMRVGHLPNHLLDATLIYWGSLPGGRWVSADVSMSGTNSCGNRRLVYIVSDSLDFMILVLGSHIVFTDFLFWICTEIQKCRLPDLQAYLQIPHIFRFNADYTYRICRVCDQ